MNSVPINFELLPNISALLIKYNTNPNFYDYDYRVPIPEFTSIDGIRTILFEYQRINPTYENIIDLAKLGHNLSMPIYEPLIINIVKDVIMLGLSTKLPKMRKQSLKKYIANKMNY